jgi:hypothetical protein
VKCGFIENGLGMGAFLPQLIRLSGGFMGSLGGTELGKPIECMALLEK